MNSRPYQIALVDDLREGFRAGAKSQLAVLPTGGGKTMCMAVILASAVPKGSRALVVAPRREILQQTKKKVEDCGIPADQIGMIAAGFKSNPKAPVQIASIQTLARRVLPQADLVFIDEAHHSCAKSYEILFEHYKESYIIGWTATPSREDGAGLGKYYERMSVIATPRDLIDQGFLVEPIIYRHQKEHDFSGAKGHGKDYNEKRLSAILDRSEIIGDVVEHWLRHASHLLTLVFAVDVQHGLHLRDAFIENGIAAEFVSGETPASDRDAIFGRLRSGKTRIVVNVLVATEGTDLPMVKCLVIARPTLSLALHIQMCGRCMRPWPDNPTLRPIILDHANNTMRHGLPHEDRFWTLDGVKRRGAGEAPVKSCPSCFAVMASAVRECTECGHVFIAESGPELVDGTLTEVTSVEDDEVERLRVTCRKMCYAADKKYGLRDGTTASKLKAHWRKSLGEQTLDELRISYKNLRKRLDAPVQRERRLVAVI